MRMHPIFLFIACMFVGHACMTCTTPAHARGSYRATAGAPCSVTDKWTVGRGTGTSAKVARIDAQRDWYRKCSGGHPKKSFDMWCVNHKGKEVSC